MKAVTVQPKGSLSLAIDGVAELLAASPTFQEATGLDRFNLKRERIFYGEIDGSEQELRALRPMAILVTDGHGFFRIGQSCVIELAATGGVLVVLTANAAAVSHPNDAYLSFTNFAGQVLDDLRERSGQSYDHGTKSYWPFDDVKMAEFPQRTQRDHRACEDFWAAGFILQHKV